ncbi:pyruvate formate lyase-activating protein [Microbacterium sp. VKM Ac-2870]|uniref:pyruvate formate-lyase-activating protein n=1 Tax=Microbacterium sp. VKM Ac-2870 TaxID=2783825 RepID=UPI00188D0075|nr:pyruvate formate-lyase-activating protein [Microbacterium sp. VKM Ac-2870]MBF4561820.1 pyruvate formate lyase-activating protein [Microbacterium sp. VKM Ac-2870]
MAATMLRRHPCNAVPSRLPDDAVRLEVPLQAPAHRRTGAGLDGLTVSDVDHHERLTAMREGRLGSVHSWELVTAVDGPGTRLTTFLSGCPLQCLYCHNPDTLAMKDGQPVTSDELLARIARYTAVFHATGGGITLSGGEVLMQPAFAARILRGAKELGIHTAIDTSGYLGAAASDAMLDDVDLVLLDVKSGDPDTYRTVTGRELEPTLTFGRRLAARAEGPEVWIRYVLVPGLTDDVDNVEAVAVYAASLNEVRPGTVTRVEVLPFHQMGRDKWDALGRDYQLADTEPPSVDLVDRVRAQFRAHDLLTF